MSDRAQPVTRRTVLRTAGAAAATAVGLGGVAAADLEPQDCATVTEDSTLYDGACPLGDAVDEISEGSEVQVLDLCTDSDGNEWAQVASNSTGLIGPWMTESHLMETTC